MDLSLKSKSIAYPKIYFSIEWHSSCCAVRIISLQERLRYKSFVDVAVSRNFPDLSIPTLNITQCSCCIVILLFSPRSIDVSRAETSWRLLLTHTHPSGPLRWRGVWVVLSKSSMLTAIQMAANTLTWQQSTYQPTRESPLLSECVFDCCPLRPDHELSASFDWRVTCDRVGGSVVCRQWMYSVWGPMNSGSDCWWQVSVLVSQNCVHFAQQTACDWVTSSIWCEFLNCFLKFRSSLV